MGVGEINFRLRFDQNDRSGTQVDLKNIWYLHDASQKGMHTRRTKLSVFESQNGSGETLQTCSTELIFGPGTVRALGFEELRSIAPSDTPPCCTSPRKLGSRAIFSNANIEIGNLQWCSLDFQLNLKICQVPYLWVAR